MDAKALLKYNSSFTKSEESAIAIVEARLNSLDINSSKIPEYTVSILDILHKGLSIDKINYIDKVFFNYFILAKNVKPHKKRIYEQLRNIENYAQDSIEEQTHLVNVYRNIVSDLFDSAINIIVATLQFIDGKFKDMQQVNLSLGERNKYEYSLSKLKPTNLFDAYNPVIRNAISHSGTEGIHYEEGFVVFRSVKRGTSPSIEYKKISNKELRKLILQLLDFIESVDISINIFGIDIQKIIQAEEKLSAKFLDQILDKEDRLGFQGNMLNEIKLVIANESLAKRDKLDFLGKVLFLACGERGISIQSISFNDTKKLVYISIPSANVDFNNESDIVNRVLQMTRYGILAEPLFNFYYESYIIQETKEELKSSLTINVSGKSLKEYNQEKAGLVDLINDSEISANGNRIQIVVDFNKLSDIEYSGTERRFPRKQR